MKNKRRKTRNRRKTKNKKTGKKERLHDRGILDRIDQKFLFLHKGKLAYDVPIQEIAEWLIPKAEYDPDYKGKILTYKDETNLVKYNDITYHKDQDILFWFDDVVVQIMDSPRLFIFIDRKEKNINLVEDRKYPTRMNPLDDIIETNDGFTTIDHYLTPSNFNKRPSVWDDLLVMDDQLLYLLKNNVVDKKKIKDIFPDCTFAEGITFDKIENKRFVPHEIIHDFRKGMSELSQKTGRNSFNTEEFVNFMENKNIKKREKEVIITVIEPKNFDIFKMKSIEFDENNKPIVEDFVVAFISDNKELVHRFGDFMEDLIEKRVKSLQNGTFQEKYLSVFQSLAKVLVKLQPYNTGTDYDSYETFDRIYVGLMMVYSTLLAIRSKDIIGTYTEDKLGRFIFMIGTKKLDTDTITKRINEKNETEIHGPLSHYEFHFKVKEISQDKVLKTIRGG
jgi:hypothetical protein